MGACTYVGRVGGLAVALGVGAAVLGGTAVGWADDNGAGGSPADHGSTQSHVPSRTPHVSTAAGATGGASPSAPGRGTRTAGAAAAVAAPTVARSSDSVATAIPALGEKTIQQSQPEAAPAVDPQPAIDVSATAPATADAAPQPTSAPVAVVAPVAVIAPVAPTVTAPLAAPAATVASVPTGALTALEDPRAGANGGGAPVDTPLDWTLLAYSRRNPLSAAATTSIPGPAATTTGPTLPIIIGPSGVPIPSAKYGDTVMNYYITYDTLGTQQLLFTPEGLYPITGVKSLPFDTSVDQGIQILSDSLSKLPAGTPVTVFGYSQSAVMSSLLQGGYTIKVDGQDVKFSVPAGVQDSINFVLVGNEMNPDGGFFSRFSGRNMPMFSLTSLGIDFYGATPGAPVPATGVEYPTTNYTREYDGFADFPRYPINFLADLNAGLGIVYVHPQYTPTITQAQCAEKAFCLLQTEVEAAQPLPSTKPATQQYFFIPTENLPLVQPLRAIPFIGNPIADLLQPALKVLVNFGYADPAHGFAGATQPYANLLQPFDALPPWNLYGDAVKQFVAGIGQGIKDFIGDFGPGGSVAKEISAFHMPTLTSGPMTNSTDFIKAIQTGITSFADYISGAAASLYAAFLPTADIVNSILTTLPAYDVNLFLYGMQQVFSGDVINGLVNAIGLPIAATVGLTTTAGLVGALVWAQAVAGALPVSFG